MAGERGVTGSMRIELRGVSLRFGDHAPLFEGLDLSLGTGDFAVIEGASGCGKSSLLRLLNRLHEPSAGELLVDGAPVEDAPALRRRAILVPQTPVVVPGTVRDNLRFPFRFRVHRYRTPPGDPHVRALLDSLLLDAVDLDEDAAPLSVGQRQRLSLARALLLSPRMLLCDEPTSALDDDARHRVEEILQGQCAAGLGVVLVSHQPFVTRRVTARRYHLGSAGLRQVHA